MTDILLIINLILTAAVLVMIIAVLNKKPAGGGDFEHFFKLLSADNANTRDYLSKVFGLNAESMTKSTDRMAATLSEKFADLERRIEDLTKANEYRLRLIQEDNAKQLEKVRELVGEKLDQTLGERLNKSFEIINSRLEAVYKGLGEMQGLARGVGDLKKVLSNVKVRGTFGELQLHALLEQVLTANQFVASFKPNTETDDRVDFAVKLPGKDDRELYLPIDAKFPVEEYHRLIEASEACDAEGLEKAAKGLEARVMSEGKKIAEKYINPPVTTDFAILYLPMEGLYAEVLRRTGLIENLQKLHIVLCGPTTLGALLNSLQLGFKTVAIEKRSAELWNLLSAFKTEFFRFTDLLVKTQKKLSEASSTIDDAARKTRTIQRKLSSVSELSEMETDVLLEE